MYSALVVDDFLVQYTNLDDFVHLAKTLSPHYGITMDMGATKFCGIMLRWDYNKGHITLSMPGYIAEGIQRFTHPPHKRPSTPHIDGSHWSMEHPYSVTHQRTRLFHWMQRASNIYKK
jgi:hypothetical protein